MSDEAKNPKAAEETGKVDETGNETPKAEEKKADAPKEDTPKADKKDEKKAEEKKDEMKAEEKKDEKKDDKADEHAGSARDTDDVQEIVEEPDATAMIKDKIQDRNGEKWIKLEDLPSDLEYGEDEFAELSKLYENTLTEIKEGQIVTGRIIAIGDKEVAVDIGFKSEGAVLIEEFDDPKALQVGDQIDVYLDTVEDNEGQLLLSKKKADFMRVWERVRAVYENDGIIKGRCTRRIKGGMVVDLGGVDAFLPGSQIDVRPIRDFESLIGEEMDFRILKINDLRKNVVISHKVLVEESLREVREKLLSSLQVGDVLEGAVKNITDFGVFVDLGGVDGLLHITDLSWGRVTHPSEVVQLDQKIKVKVLNYDEERKRISLGLKQLYPHLWDEIDKKYMVGQKVQGQVVSLAKYGAFVEIEPGIEGLIHISEMSWTQHVRHPSQIVHEQDYVQVMILNIDKDNRKISLGLKQVEDDPWQTFEAKYRVGTRHQGTVRDLVPFGAFVELEDNIDGLIHISDLSWTKKVRHPGEVLKKGQEIEVIILDFDRNERRIALGYKQLEENPWEMFERDVKEGGKTSGVVTRIIDKGVLVELPHKIEGFVPNSQISRKYFDGKKRNIQVGDIIKLQLLEFDSSDHKAVLSNSQAEEKEERSQSAAYVGKGSHAKTTLMDTLDENNPLLKELRAAQEEEKAAKKKEKAEAKAKKEEQKKAEEKAEEKKAAKEDKAEAKAEEKKPDAKAEAKAEKEDKPAEPEAKKEAKAEKEDKPAEPEAKAEAEVEKEDKPAEPEAKKEEAKAEEEKPDEEEKAEEKKEAKADDAKDEAKEEEKKDE